MLSDHLFGMTMLGFYFDVLGESEWYMYAGFAAGTVIFFIIGQMIVKKTPRIYNLKSLKSLGIYCLIAVVFILGLKFDITGFEKRVPDPAKVRSFTIEEYFNHEYGFLNSSMYPAFKGSSDEDVFSLKNPENIAAATELHRSLVENKARFESLKGLLTSGVHLTYNPDSTLPTSRIYTVDYNFYRNSPEFKKIYESEEFKNFYAPGNLNYEELSLIHIIPEIPFSESVELKNKAEMQEFIACIDNDFKAQSFEDMSSLRHKYASVRIGFKYKNRNSDTPEKLLETTVDFTITDNYTKTIQWLKEHGYEDRFIQKASDIEYIELFHYVFDGDEKNIYPGNSNAETINMKSLKITDPVRIQELLDSYEYTTINYNDYYSGVIVYKWSSEYQQQYEDYMHESAYKEKFGSDVDSKFQKQIYFNEGNVPDYVLQYFN